MKTPMKQLMAILVVLLLALSLSAQTFDHVIIIVQENRTPDNLFGASGLPGADLQIHPKGTAVALNTTGDFDHSHVGFLAEASGTYPHGSGVYVASGVDPYWQLAAEYGFANYMFQTNQGASFPARQMLISGTSAPSDTSDLFVSDNSITGTVGCKAKAGSLVPTIAPDGVMGAVFPCFERSSLIDLLVNAGLTWRYYAAAFPPLWAAPNSLKSYYLSSNLVKNPPQVLTDIQNETLANVSWVSPAKSYSDHARMGTGGPAWVASIVNAIGNSSYWDNTVIFVTWDDWGGLWDHVPPLQNNTGWCEVYCYGFRVPLLVISAYTPQGYVDNGVHDFGSILHFVETNFALGFIGPGGWADYHADDLSTFFTSEPRAFVQIKARKLTKAELKDQGGPDTD